jgi:hypothetical protein
VHAGDIDEDGRRRRPARRQFGHRTVGRPVRYEKFREEHGYRENRAGNDHRNYFHGFVLFGLIGL